MDQKGKVYSLLKIFGIILILLATITFAKAESWTFDCSTTFNCSIKSYCEGVPGAVPGLLVGDGTASSYTLGPQPTEYSFTSSRTGTAICSVTATVSAMADQGQVNENTTVYINGINMGTTIDNYCNGPGNPSDPSNCVFCGRDTQTLSSKTITINSNNTLKVYGHDSHAVASVILDCDFYGKDCSTNLGPIMDTIPDKTIKYNTSFSMDLWNYIDDYDDAYSDLNIEFAKNNSLLSCTLTDERYLNCSSSASLGTTQITISATDPCETKTKSFNVVITNSPPHIAVPDQTKSCVEDLNLFLDLRDYTYDEEKDLLEFAILSQSNTSLLNCSIENDFYVSCQVNTCTDSYSDLNVQATDRFGLTHSDIFRITLQNSAPYFIKDLPEKCFNYDSAKFLDLREYATDLEDGNALTFTLTQANKDDIECYIDDSYYLSCKNVSNRHTTNTVTIKATDSKGLSVQKNMTIKTQCGGDIVFDANIQSICLEDCTSYSTRMRVANNSDEEKCFNFDLDKPSTLSASLTRTSFCLNPDETTYFTLSASTCGADNTNYTATVYDTDNNLSLDFDYSIGACSNFDGFRMTEYDGKICKGEEREFLVEVKNSTDITKTIDLMAENQFLLPYFTQDDVTIGAYDEKEVRLHINAKHASVGYKTILLGGDAPNYHIEKKLEIEVVDCSDIQERNFLITAQDICYDVRKGQTFQGSFNVKRLSNGCSDCSYDTKGVSLFLSGMPYELSYSLLELRSGQERSVNYTIYVPIDATAGHNFITISGSEVADTPFDDEFGFIEPKEICLNVLGESNSNILLRTQTKDILWCDSEIFELEIQNIGDFTETFDLSALEIPTGVSVFFSESHVTVAKGTSKIIYVSIATSPDSEIRDNQSITVKLDGNIDLTTKIYFNVKSKPSFEDMEILSSSEVITTKTNSETKYYIMIRNNTESELRNVKISFENAPTDMNFQELLIDSIAKGQVVSLEGKIITKDTNGVFYPVFVVSSYDKINKKAFTLVVEDDGQNQNGGFLGIGTGFFGFGVNFSELTISFFAAIILAVFLILLILGIILVSSRKTKKEVWLGVEYK